MADYVPSPGNAVNFEITESNPYTPVAGNLVNFDFATPIEGGTSDRLRMFLVL